MEGSQVTGLFQSQQHGAAANHWDGKPCCSGTRFAVIHQGDPTLLTGIGNDCGLPGTQPSRMRGVQSLQFDIRHGPQMA